MSGSVCIIFLELKVKYNLLDLKKICHLVFEIPVFEVLRMNKRDCVPQCKVFKQQQQLFRPTAESF